LTLVDFLALIGAFFFFVTALAVLFTVILRFASLLLLDSAFLIIWANQSSTSSLLPALESALESFDDLDAIDGNDEDFDSEEDCDGFVDTEGPRAACFGARLGNLIFPSFTSFNFPTGNFFANLAIVLKTFLAIYRYFAKPSGFSSFCPPA
jgi:hypothetical protein